MMILLSLLVAAPAPAPVPKSPYLPAIYRYADTLLEHGRDTNRGLFLSALDRHALKPLTNRPPAPSGIREEDRVGPSGGPLSGSDPEHDQNLLRLLFTLSDLSGKPKYREAADAELRWFAREGRYKAFRPWVLTTLVPPTNRTNLTDRQAGFFVRARSTAYAQTTNEALLRLIEGQLERLEKRAESRALLSLAIDCDGAAHNVPQRLAERLRAMAARLDETFCSSPHELERSHLWTSQTGTHTSGQIAMMCVSRYENTGRVAYRELIHRAAEAYLKSAPPVEEDLWPGSLGHAISLQLAAWRSTAKEVHLDKAREFADFALEKFFDKSPLPRASLKTDHYESITGSDTLALAMVELHLHILYITAVRYPPNTIDR